MKDYEDFFSLNERVAREVDVYMAEYLAHKTSQAANIDPRFRRLLAEIERVVRLGGKRLRPTLAVVGYKAVGGQNDELALRAGVALELLHIFMCIHDDIMDHDTLRHGGLNITGRYNTILDNLEPMLRQHIAESMSLLAGDLLLTFTYEVISALDLPADTRFTLLEQLTKTTFTTVGGQLLDVLYPLEGEVSVGRLLKIPHYKTGIYTFVSPLLFGATLAGSKQAQSMEIMQEYGENLGITFQIVDDILGVFGTTESTGKPIVSDMRENKPTILRHYAFELSSPEEHAVLEAAFGNPIAGSKELDAVRKIMVSNGARAKTFAQAEQYAHQAKQALLPLSEAAPEQYGQLVQLADFCLTRDH